MKVGGLWASLPGENAIIAVLIDLFWCIPGELHQNGFWCQSPCWLWAWLSQLWLLKVQFLHNLLHVLPSISLFVLLDKQIHLTILRKSIFFNILSKDCTSWQYIISFWFCVQILWWNDKKKILFENFWPVILSLKSWQCFA